MLEPPILFMVAPGCENVLGNFFPVPLMVAALGALQWKRYQHRCLSGLEAGSCPRRSLEVSSIRGLYRKSCWMFLKKPKCGQSFSRIRIAGTSQETIRLESAETVFLK